MKVLVAITGASGIAYALRLLQALQELGIEHECIISDAARKILKHEAKGAELRCYSEHEIEAPFSSGSHRVDAMVVIPCSMKTLAAIANGYAGNLITRSADVMLKERRRLVLVPRETPLNAIHLENMLKLARLGAVILPAMPAFYHQPESIDDLLGFIAGKVLDALGIEHGLYRRWGGE
ncbi:MAG: UbiX family flavin prenyltransferase [Euryarchaeota archaeon]|nr:UbiX family flavin prenyltransferase [Euryarchaeota archaeon]